MEYNTDREHLTLKEYGRNIGKMVEYMKTVEDQEKRDSFAETLVELMKQINPNVRDSNDYNQKVWDDLFIISGFKLEVKSPFPIPNSEILEKKPERVQYKSNEIKFKHYGRNLEIMIELAKAMEDPEEREGAIISIGRLMKSFFYTWNKDSVEDKVIALHINRMSGGELVVDLPKVEEHKLFDSSRRERPDRPTNRNDNQRRKNGGKRNFRDKKRRN